MSVKRKRPLAKSVRFLFVLFVIFLLSRTVSFAATSFVGYTALPPLTVFDGDFYSIVDNQVYREPEGGGERSLLFSLNDDHFRTVVKDPQLYSYEGKLWTVIENADSGAVLLRGYAEPYSEATNEIILRAWPEQGRFVNGQFYYSAAEAGPSQISLYAVDLASGVSIQIEKRSVLTFAATDRFLYFAPYELLSDGQGGRVTFASEPPYEVYRFDTVNGNLAPLGFGIPFPDVYVIGDKVLALNPKDNDLYQFECLSFDFPTGDHDIACSIESQSYPLVIVNRDYIVMQTTSSEAIEYRVYDKQLNEVNRFSVALRPDLVPVALTGNRLYCARRASDSATGYLVYSDYESFNYLTEGR